MKCHFVYAVPQKGYLGKLRRMICYALQRTGYPVSAFNRTNPDTSWWPKRSPFENTRHIFEGLSSRMPTCLYSLEEYIRCNFASEDIFLGHPVFPYKKGKKGVTELSLEEISGSRPRITAIISPIHCQTTVETRHINKMYLGAVDKLIGQVNVFFAIMGRYWWDRWPSSPFAHWLPKMTRLDMAIETIHFPRVKRRFNKPGNRGYFYIGTNDPMKGLDFFSKLTRRLGKCRCGWIGYGSNVEGVPKISGSRHLTPDFMRKIAEDFDFFVSPSVADPNPTTILESMAWGFPVICTPQSGYYETDFRRNIYHEDFERSVQILNELQYMNEDGLIKMADSARTVVERDYTWERFLNIICEKLGVKQATTFTEQGKG